MRRLVATDIARGPVLTLTLTFAGLVVGEAIRREV